VRHKMHRQRQTDTTPTSCSAFPSVLSVGLESVWCMAICVVSLCLVSVYAVCQSCVCMRSACLSSACRSCVCLSLSVHFVSHSLISVCGASAFLVCLCSLWLTESVCVVRVSYAYESSFRLLRFGLIDLRPSCV